VGGRGGKRDGEWGLVGQFLVFFLGGGDGNFDIVCYFVVVKCVKYLMLIKCASILQFLWCVKPNGGMSFLCGSFEFLKNITFHVGLKIWKIKIIDKIRIELMS
jgi:hypothetical protein